MKYPKQILAVVAALALGVMIILKPGLFAGIMVVFVITAIIFFIAIATLRKKESSLSPAEKEPAVKKPEKKGGWGWIAALGIFLVAAYHSYQYFSEKPHAPVTKTTTIEVVARPDQWSENISIPPGYWFRITSGEKMIAIRTWDGREIRDEPGKQAIAWLGNEIQRANFKVRSLENGEVRVLVLLQKET